MEFLRIRGRCAEADKSKSLNDVNRLDDVRHDEGGKTRTVELQTYLSTAPISTNHCSIGSMYSS